MKASPLGQHRFNPPPGNPSRLLSKSRFVAGLQFHKRLYYECYHHDMRDPSISPRRALRDGLARRGSWRGGLRGRRCASRGPRRMRCGTTAAALDNRAKAIYEAAFNHSKRAHSEWIFSPPPATGPGF